MSPTWEKIHPDAPNLILDGEGFTISFNPGIASIFALFAPIFGEEVTPKPETALVNEENGQRIFRILNGDFRKDYEGLVSQGWDACLAFFNTQREEHGSGWSTNPEDRRTDI